LKLKAMRARRIIAVIVLLVVAFLIVFPPLMNGGVKVTLSSTISLQADHLYVTISEISAHRLDISGPSAWQSISNKSTLVDLTMTNVSEVVALGGIPLGQYEAIRVKVTNATIITNGASRNLQLESSLISVSVPFLVQFGTDVVVTLKVAPEIQESASGASLKLLMTAMPT
jgi:hypothetical protein